MRITIELDRGEPVPDFPKSVWYWAVKQESFKIVRGNNQWKKVSK